MKRKLVCIQGLGFVGSAMATAVALANDENGKPVYDVVGVDLPDESGNRRVDSINKGDFPFYTSDQSLVSSLKKVSNQGNLRATTDSNVYSEADIVVIDVQLDIPYLDNEPQLEMSDFKNAIRTVGKNICAETLIVVETTVPPGTCEKIVAPVLHDELIKRKVDPKSVFIAHSYERVMPGENYLSSITDYWRVFAGITKEAGDACELFLSNVVNVIDFPLTRLSCTTASETAKVMENTYRAINIAFIDEWTKYAESVGIDLFEVIDSIRKRPTHSNIRFPGLGVGGYCLTKDPTFTPAAANQIFNKNLNFPFSKMAVKINHDMPLHSLSRLKSLMNGSIKEKKILVCGISYRQEVGDTRYSPTETLVREMIKQGSYVTCHDPYLDDWEEVSIPLLKKLPSFLDFDAVIFAVPHKYYRNFNLSNSIKKGAIVLDTNRVFGKEQRESARENNIIVESIGRGDGL